MPDYVEFDLSVIIEQLGVYEPPAVSRCPVCAENGTRTLVDETMAACPTCGTIVIWHHSKIWAESYGHPSNMVGALCISLAQTAEQKQFLDRSGLAYFTNVAEREFVTRCLKAGLERTMSIGTWWREKRRPRKVLIASLRKAFPQACLPERTTPPSEEPLRKREVLW